MYIICFEAICKTPDINQKTLAKNIGKSQSNISKIVKEMEEANYVKIIRH